MEIQIGPAGRPISAEYALFQCKICLVSKPKEFFPFLPCCSYKKINRDACASCVATALTVPTDNKCPRCREFVQLVATVNSGRPPYKIVDAIIHLGAIEKCLSCGAMKRLIYPSRVCKDCQRYKQGPMPQILYECQVCHQEQYIPYPIYKTQRTPRHYGNPAWWPCNNACGGKSRRWRIVESELSKLENESAPHSWAQYFVRKELNCLPQDPAKITTETKLKSHENVKSMAVDVGPGRFVADEVDIGGNSFLVPCQQFPIAESLEDDNDEWLDRKTTLRLKNERSRQIHAVLAHWLPNGYVHCRLISPESSKSTDANNESDEDESDGPFKDEDWLVAIDYLPLLMSQAFSRTPFWIRQEFSIQQAQTTLSGSQIPSLGWNVQPYNVRIGKIGIFVGGNDETSEYSEGKGENVTEDQDRDIILDINVDHPVTALWTDAIDLSISLLEPTGAEMTEIVSDEDVSYPISLLADDKHPSIRHFPDGKPLHGPLRVQFSSVSYKTLQGLASPMHGGGLHLSLLAPSSPTTNDDAVEEVTEPPDLTVMPAFSVEELQSSSVAFLRGQIRNMTINEKRRRFLQMIVDESHREQFEKNVIGEEVETVLEPMLGNEDFVRRYMRPSGNLEEEDGGWIDPNAKEDNKNGEDEDRRPPVGFDGSQILLTDTQSKSGIGWLSNTARGVWESVGGNGHSGGHHVLVPSTVVERGVDTYEDEPEEENRARRVDMDGLVQF